MAFVAFPHIGQLRHLEATLRGREDLPARLRYRGTVKLHGSNGGVLQLAGELLPQKRTSFVDVGSDNFGFAAFVEEHAAAFERLFASLRAQLALPVDVPCRLFGEVAGRGVQKGVAISALPRFFAIFAVQVRDCFLDLAEFPELHAVEARIYNVLQFGSYDLCLSRGDAMASLPEVRELTDAIGRRCPAGAFLGVEGAGEGLVWQCLDDPDPALWFKSKTEALQAAPDVLALDGDLQQRAQAFAAAVMTPARLVQAEAFAAEKGRRGKAAIGVIVAWATEDALREEGQELSEEERRACKAALTARARCWALERSEPTAPSDPSDPSDPSV